MSMSVLNCAILKQLFLAVVQTINHEQSVMLEFQMAKNKIDYFDVSNTPIIVIMLHVSFL